ncbi:MAG: hypothetical protein ACJ77N_07640 [Chloroflexota bacterium]
MRQLRALPLALLVLIGAVVPVLAKAPDAEVIAGRIDSVVPATTAGAGFEVRFSTLVGKAMLPITLPGVYLRLTRSADDAGLDFPGEWRGGGSYAASVTVPSPGPWRFDTVIRIEGGEQRVLPIVGSTRVVNVTPAAAVTAVAATDRARSATVGSGVRSVDVMLPVVIGLVLAMALAAVAMGRQTAGRRTRRSSTS